MEHMLREIFEKDVLYEVEITWDGSVYTASLFVREDKSSTVLTARQRNQSMFDAVSALHTYVMNS